MSVLPEILYFDIRGRAEPIRLLLEDVGAQYTDRQITQDDWSTIRETTPFHRMPVYREGDLNIPETFAIISYLGRKFDLLGENEAARIRCDVTIEAWNDYGNRVANTFGALSNSDAARKMFLESEQPALLGNLEAFYVERDNKTAYWAGNSPTIADYAAFHLVDGLVNQFPDTMSQFGALREFHECFRVRPNIEAYLSSSRRPAALFYGPNGKIFPR